MCIYCHKLNDEKTLNSLRRNIENPCYEIWHANLIVDLKLIAEGLNGEECKKLALELLSGYIEFMDAKAQTCKVTKEVLPPLVEGSENSRPREFSEEFRSQRYDMLYLKGLPYSEVTRKKLREEMMQKRRRQHLSFKDSISMEEIETMLS